MDRVGDDATANGVKRSTIKIFLDSEEKKQLTGFRSASQLGRRALTDIHRKVIPN